MSASPLCLFLYLTLSVQPPTSWTTSNLVAPQKEGSSYCKRTTSCLKSSTQKERWENKRSRRNWSFSFYHYEPFLGFFFLFNYVTSQVPEWLWHPTTSNGTGKRITVFCKKKKKPTAIYGIEKYFPEKGGLYKLTSIIKAVFQGHPAVLFTRYVMPLRCVAKLEVFKENSSIVLPKILSINFAHLQERTKNY